MGLFGFLGFWVFGDFGVLGGFFFSRRENGLQWLLEYLHSAEFF